eukprot:1210182-Heterocapsa_arctica.AAC.1
MAAHQRVETRRRRKPPGALQALPGDLGFLLEVSPSRGNLDFPCTGTPTLGGTGRLTVNRSSRPAVLLPLMIGPVYSGIQS